MLWSALDRDLGQIAAPADETSGGRSAPRPEPEQGLKRGHRGLAPVIAKDEFVEIDLQVMSADAMVGADEPLLQVADGAVCGPPIQVSSISTSPCRGSRAALTIARRSLCKISQAVSYRRMANWRCNSSAEILRLSVVIRYAAQNHSVNGVLVRWNTVPAVSDTWYRHVAHSRHRPSRRRNARPSPQRGHRKPSGQRQASKYSRHAPSSANCR